MKCSIPALTKQLPNLPCNHMTLYREDIIDLYKNPLNMREIKPASVASSGANVLCGDRVRIYLKLDGDTITVASFSGEGCAISIAAASFVTEEVKGKKVSSVLRLGPKE